jgi:hypothetical protein
VKDITGQLLRRLKRLKVRHRRRLNPAPNIPWHLVLTWHLPAAERQRAIERELEEVLGLPAGALHGPPVLDDEPPADLTDAEREWAEVIATAKREANEPCPIEAAIAEVEAQALPHRLPCGLRELAPDERPAISGDEQERTD